MHLWSASSGWQLCGSCTTSRTVCDRAILAVTLQDLGHGETLTYAPWPVADESLLVEDTINLPVQVSHLPCAVKAAAHVAQRRQGGHAACMATLPCITRTASLADCLQTICCSNRAGWPI